MNRCTLRNLLLGATVAAALALTGCTASGFEDSSPSASVPKSSASASAPEQAGSAEASPSPSAGESQPAPTWDNPTCDNTITADSLARYQAAGWTGQVRDQTWLIGGRPAKNGILCQWMEDHSVVPDNFTWLGWAPAADAEAMITDLILEGGWRREDATEGIYVTADDAQMMPIVDADGYGATYLFVDGQVRYASTKSELVSITAPPGFTP
jgi:hypothetical protein